MVLDSKDISVIVQGDINKSETPKCLASIRKYLPDAEIILSTWEDSDVSNLEYDILIESEMPEAIHIETFSSKVVYNNMNRQLLSTQQGLKKANRKYAMKLRSDLILTGNKFLDYFDEFQERGESYNLFKRKVLTSTLFTRYNIKCHKQKKRILLPFHISDWWLFGLTEDINKYFLETPLVKEPYFTKYFDYEENQDKPTPYGKVRYRFAPEQYFGYECFARNFDNIYMEDAADYSEELMEKSRQCLVNNFIVLEFKQSGIYLNKYPYSKNEKFAGDQYIGLYNFYRYETEYKKYCDHGYEIKTNDKMFKNETEAYDLLRIYKHIATLIDNTAPLRSRIEQLFIGIPVSLISYCVNAACGKYRSIK